MRRGTKICLTSFLFGIPFLSLCFACINVASNITVLQSPPAEQDVIIETTCVTEPVYTKLEIQEHYLMPLESYSWAREDAPEFIMIHFTSDVVANKENPYDYGKIRNIYVMNEVSAHYFIDRDGQIFAWVPEDRVAWHAGAGSFKGDEKYTNKMNYYAIGIELAGIGTADEMSIYMHKEEYDKLNACDIGFTEKQYESLSLLVDDLCLRYDIPKDRDHIIGHSEFAPDKVDPGELFLWNLIIEN